MDDFADAVTRIRAALGPDSWDLPQPPAPGQASPELHARRQRGREAYEQATQARGVPQDQARIMASAALAWADDTMSNLYPIRCQIRNEDASATRIDVYDDIGEGGWFSEGLTAKAFVAQLAAVKGPLDVHVSSGGGDVWDGIAIGNAIRAHKGTVTTVVDGIAASIASVIVQAGQERIMTPGSMMMIHDAFGVAIGDAAELAKMAQTLDQVSGNIAAIYAYRCGGTADQWRDAMKAETWYTAGEAVAAKLADTTGT